MSLSLEKTRLDNLAGDIWKSTVRLRGKFKAYEYQNVILPIIVIRRLECVLISWREHKQAEFWPKGRNCQRQREKGYIYEELLRDATCSSIDAAAAAKRKQIVTLDANKVITHKAVTSGLGDTVELKDSGLEWLGKVRKY